MIGASTTLRELAFLVCTAFDDAGETVVLSGGGAATIYAPEAHQSRDLDFIFALWSVDGQVSDGPMRALGFAERGGTYGHPACPYTVEFPAGPLAVGDDSIDTWDTLEEGGNRLHIISPTDCVRDRLAWFFYGRDHSAYVRLWRWPLLTRSTSIESHAGPKKRASPPCFCSSCVVSTVRADSATVAKPHE
ncbi:MAG: hypothetical protein IT363_01545 [Methanoregulaceae archaeon]|nr:hypothetical protein [Methanoregulaceae archaeon]